MSKYYKNAMGEVFEFHGKVANTPLELKQMKLNIEDRWGSVLTKISKKEFSELESEQNKAIDVGLDIDDVSEENEGRVSVYKKSFKK